MNSLNPPFPAQKDIKSLIDFLPIFSEEGFVPIKRWEGQQEIEEGVFQFPFPIYDPKVTEFFALAGQPCWTDYEYTVKREMIEAAIRDQASVGTFTLADVRTALTYCVRGERFNDGHWGQMIKCGFIASLLSKLIEFVC